MSRLGRLSLARRLAVAVAVAAGALLAGADPASWAQTFGRPGLVVKATPVTVPAGGHAETRITLELQKNYRIVAPGSPGKYSQPPVLAFDAADGVYVEPVSWPEGVFWRAHDEDPEVKVYEGRLELKVIVHAAAKAAQKEVALQGRLRLQSIRGDYFEKVAVMPLSIPVTVAPPPAPAGKPATRR